jgi:hypothetical protein
VYENKNSIGNQYFKLNINIIYFNNVYILCIKIRKFKFLTLQE